MAPPEATENEQDGMEELRPAWSLPAEGAESITVPFEWPGELTREWAWGGSTGKGVRVCILDSGVEAGHPLVGEVQRSVAVSVDADGEVTVEDDHEGDLCGHGTACAGIVRSLAPDCELSSVRVLGAGFTGSGGVLLAGLRWAVEENFDIINMSLSTTKRQFAGILHELTDSGVLPAQRARRLGPQHACRELSVALLLGHLGRVATTSPTRRPSSTTPIRRSSSSPAVSTSRWHGPGVPPSAAPATASRRRTCPGSARSSSASIRS